MQVAVECLRDPQQGVDPRRPAAALESRDRGLRRSDEVRELPLREPELGTPLCHLVRDLREEPSLVGSCEPAPQAVERLT